MCPAILNYCNIDCYIPWLREALTEVASNVLSSEVVESSLKPRLANLYATIHLYMIENFEGLDKSTGNMTHASMASYLEFLKVGAFTTAAKSVVEPPWA